MMSTKIKTTTGLILLFLFGMIAGVAFTLIVEGGIIRKAFANPDQGRQIVANRLSRNLNLTVEQREALDEILLDTQYEMCLIREETAPAVEKVLEESRLRIEGILTPEQVKEFEEMYEQLQQGRERYGRMHQQRHRYGRGMGPRQGGGGMHRGN